MEPLIWAFFWGMLGGFLWPVIADFIMWAVRDMRSSKPAPLEPRQKQPTFKAFTKRERLKPKVNDDTRAWKLENNREA